MRFGISFLALGAAAAVAWAADEVQVGIVDYKYSPEMLTVKVGTAVRWTNNEKRVSHSILFLGSGGFESERIFPGESYVRVFDQAGRYDYTCGPHPEMKGRVVVE